MGDHPTVDERLQADLPGHACTVCFERFSTERSSLVPRVLTCGHTYCTGCCDKLLKDRHAIDCPKCHYLTNVSGGVDMLTKNFGVLEIVESDLMISQRVGESQPRPASESYFGRPSSPDQTVPDRGARLQQHCVCCHAQMPTLLVCDKCRAILCPSCADGIHRWPRFNSHMIRPLAQLTIGEMSTFLSRGSDLLQSVSVTTTDREYYCEEHEDKKKVFCRTCAVLICVYCQLHGSHQGHDCVFASEQALVGRARLSHLTSALDQRRQEMFSAYNTVMDTSESIQNCSSHLEDELHSHFVELRNALDQRESALLQVLRVFIDERLSTLHDQSCELTSVMSEMKTLSQRTEDAVQDNSYAVLSRMGVMEADIDRLLRRRCRLDPLARDDLVFRWRNVSAPDLEFCSGRSNHPSTETDDADAATPGRSLLSLITHHGELMMLPPVMPHCHCTPYLNVVRVFWPPADMPDLPIVEYRLEHVYRTSSKVGLDQFSPDDDRFESGVISDNEIESGVEAIACEEGVPVGADSPEGNPKKSEQPRSAGDRQRSPSSSTHHSRSRLPPGSVDISAAVGNMSYIRDHSSDDEDVDIDTEDDRDATIVYDVNRDAPTSTGADAQTSDSFGRSDQRIGSPVTVGRDASADQSATNPSGKQSGQLSPRLPLHKRASGASLTDGSTSLKREVRCIVYRGQQCMHDMEHKFSPNTEHAFRVCVCSQAGQGPWSPLTRIAIPGPAFTWSESRCHRNASISNHNLSASVATNRFWITVGADTALDKGCHYWECVLEQYGSPSRNWKVVVGVVGAKVQDSAWQRDKAIVGAGRSFGQPSWGYVTAQGKKLCSLTTSSWGQDYATSSSHGRCVEGDVVGVLLDLDEGKLEFFHNRHSLGVAFDNVYGPVIPAVSFYHDKRVRLRFAPSPN